MNRGDRDLPDPDDMFADTRMSFGDHIEDLRTHLLRAIYGFLLAFLIAIPLGQPVLKFISAPVEKQLAYFYERYDDTRALQIEEGLKKGEFSDLPPVPVRLQFDLDALVNLLSKKMKLPVPEEPPVLDNMMRQMEANLRALKIDHWIDRKIRDEGRFVELPARIADPMEYAKEIFKLNRIISPRQLSTLSVQEAFVVLFKVIMMSGFVLASPWVFYQIWSFVAAGLYPQEKRLVNIYLPFSLGLFLVGVFVCQFFVIPKAIEAMLWFNEYLGFQPDLRLSEWLGFAIFMPLVFGLSFQTPLVMFFMEKIGLFSVETYKDKRRIAWFFMVIFAAVITPTVDAVTMLFLWVPMCLLYELGIWMCILSPRPPEEEWELTESEEMVEV